MGSNTLWFGYLEAGDKSTFVVTDSKLDTAQADTLYVYNHKRGEILEYKRAIAEPKFRALTADEAARQGDVEQGFLAARAGFTPRGARVADIPEKGAPPAPRRPPVASSDDEDDTIDDNISLDDVDEDEDEEETEEEYD